MVVVQPGLDPEAEEQAEVCWHCKHSDLKRNAGNACEELSEPKLVFHAAECVMFGLSFNSVLCYLGSSA